ncbi:MULTISPECIES: phosphotransferase [Gracilibacillus]|uniref:phosphotransferase n=1 Tax=Gracilibacillus TaxID=74385 RepID=UPI000826D1E1|nr:phosphotransferase family protein [Gracilibacillus timonensis]
MEEIAGYHSFVTMEPIDKGWSSDKKYYIETKDGQTLLLRIADISQYDKKKNEYEWMQEVAALGVPMSRPVHFGTCDNDKKVYSLFTWCEGEDAETVLPLLPETEQYQLGIKSGEILRMIHSIPAPEGQAEWSERFNRKADDKIKKYQACGIRFDGDDQVIDYVEKHRYLLSNRPQCFQHGDYHVGNMVISADQTLSIIDFNRLDIGDPWEEFNRIVWSAGVSPYFATGQLNGYFAGKPPIEFFERLAFYIATNALASVPWAIPFGEKQIMTLKQQTKDILSWYNDMNQVVPTWYLADFYVQYVDGISYQLKEPFDMSFIQQYGKVFKVFDNQDSGNICFGVEKHRKKYFVKFAGAPTARYAGTTDDAIERLRSIVPIYQDLAHSHLIKYVQAEHIGGGFAVVFDWVDGECMGKQYPLTRRRFMQMPLKIKLNIFDDILSFHYHVIKKGYVAIDFYDGSIMYDVMAEKTIICDIDFYAKMPYINKVGRMWGSSRFMSPEEWQQGAAIDEITNVYLMGATAFALFANDSREWERWQLNKALYKVALKAIHHERDQRQPSIQQFIEEWNKEKTSF